MPAIVDEATFNLVAEQMAENRRRVRQRRTGPLHLLQGLLVCKQCGYAYYAGGGPRHTYYLCTGSQPYRWGGKRICPNSSIREDQLDQAVWNDVRAMLSEPSRIEHELRRRTEGDEPDLQRQAMRRLEGQIEKVRRSIVRLIDAYEEGLLNKSEFEPRLVAARRHLSQLQEQLKQVNIVYRVNLSPFDPSPDRGVLQHCARRVVAFPRFQRNNGGWRGFPMHSTFGS